MSEINENAIITKDVIILGSGPAGLTAALYTARAYLSSLILTGMSLHGQAGSTDIIENYPGFPNGIGGSELGQLFQSQAERFGAEVVMDQAISVDLQKYPFIVKTYSSAYAAKSIIISTGATHKKLNVPGEKEFTGRGVSYCGTCDGWFYKDKDVIVVGGGDSALEEGIFLTRFTKSVTIIHRRDKLRAGAFLQKRAFANPKISFIWNSVVTELMGDDSLKVAKLKDVTTNEENLVSIDGVFIFIGNEPNHQLFEGQLELDEEGYIKVNRFMETSVPGVFAAGEIADPHFRQVITSAGMGAAAGIQATRYLEDLESDGP
jgi:thioredoxin reductase (NADPH)